MKTQSRNRWHIQPVYIVLALLLVGAGLLRLINLGTESLWLDEIYSVQFVAERSFLRVIGDTFQEDFHPFSYYALLDVWTAGFNCSDWMSRFLSVILSLVSIIAVFSFARSAFGCSIVATVSTVLLVISPTHIRYSQEVRMYILMMVLWPLVLHSILRCRKSWYGLKSATGLILSFQAFIYSHGTAGLLAFPVLVGGVTTSVIRATGKKRQAQLRRAFAVITCSVILYLPWIIRIVTLKSSKKELYRFGLKDVDNLLQWLLFEREFQQPTWIGPFVLIILTALVSFLIWRFYRTKFQFATILLLGSVSLVLITEMLLTFIKPCYYPRNLSFLVVPVVVLVSASIVEIFKAALRQKNQLMRWTVVILSVIFFSYLSGRMVSVTAHNLRRGYGREMWSEMVQYTSHHLTPNDMILFYTGFMKTCWDHYYYGYECSAGVKTARFVDYKTIEIDRNWDTQRFNAKMMELKKFTSALDPPNSLWVFYSHVRDPQRVDTVLQSQGLHAVGTWQGQGIILRQYRNELTGQDIP